MRTRRLESTCRDCPQVYSQARYTSLGRHGRTAYVLFGEHARHLDLQGTLVCREGAVRPRPVYQKHGSSHPTGQRVGPSAVDPLSLAGQRNPAHAQIKCPRPCVRTLPAIKLKRFRAFFMDPVALERCCSWNRALTRIRPRRPADTSSILRFVVRWHPSLGRLRRRIRQFVGDWRAVLESFGGRLQSFNMQVAYSLAGRPLHVLCRGGRLSV